MEQLDTRREILRTFLAGPLVAGAVISLLIASALSRRGQQVSVEVLDGNLTPWDAVQ